MTRYRSTTRRQILRALGGAALALPLLEWTGGTANAIPYPRRLVIVFTPNGTVKDAWTPPAAPGAPPSDFDLSYILEPLAPYRERLLILDGIDMESSYHGPGDAAHWNGMGHMLTGTELVDPGGSGAVWGGGISVDQRIAQVIGAATKLPSLELGVEALIPLVATRMSYLGPAQPVPPEHDPWKAYARLYGKRSPALVAQRRSVLDAVARDFSALEARLGAADRRKLDAHLTAIRSIEVRLDATPACAPIDLGAPIDPAAADQFPVVGRLQMDLIVAALACDITRVASLQWSYAGSETWMPWLGINESHHSLSHLPPDDPVAKQALSDINRWYAEQFAYLLSAMAAIPEGDGTLLDNSVVIWCNELSRGDTHARRGMPYVLAGSAGGHFKTGRYLQYGGAAAGDVHNNLLVSLCNAMGLGDTTFGNPAYCTGPLRWLTG